MFEHSIDDIQKVCNINSQYKLAFTIQTRPIQLILYFALISLHNFLYGICRFLCQRRPFSVECKNQRMLQTNRCGIYNLFSFCKQHQYAYPIIKMHCHNYNVKKYQIYHRQFLFRGLILDIEVMVSTFSFSFYNFNSIIFIIMLHDIYNNWILFKKKFNSKVDRQTIMVL